MAVVQGIKEKVHLPIYDSIRVEPGKQLREVASSSTLKFFVDVQGKTKLETNLQSASLLPHYNTFEARAMRVVISDLPPEFSDEDKDTIKVEELEVIENDNPVAGVTATLETTVRRMMRLLDQARASEDGEAILDADDDDITLDPQNAPAANRTVALTVDELEAAFTEGDPPPKQAPPLVQVRPNDGAGTIIGKLIYNTVTTLYVGEKQMISMPTFFFPAGAGPYSETGKFTSHGEPSPIATFRFAEPIYIDKAQNFRVEIEIPDSDTFKELQRIYGPLFIWVVLDGFMVRPVQ